MNNVRQRTRSALACVARSLTRPRRAAQRGVTLVEVLATTGISAVVLGMAAPSFLDSVRINQARGATQNLSSLLNEARTEAMKRNVPVLVCPSSDGTSCLSSVTAASWAGQTIVCYDAGGDNSCDASTSAAPNPVRVRSAVDAKVQLTGPTSVVRFNGLGAVASSVSFAVSAGNGVAQSSTITVAASGAVRAY
jgi:type IV fimbrial biogenesis protein FimT